MLVVALTGNYGMGKSSVAGMFSDCGAYTIDSDLIVADLLRHRSVIGRIRELLGTEIMNKDGSLNKTAVADIIFRDKRARRGIEALLHPLVFQAVKSSIKSLRSEYHVVIVEVPLLFEGSFESFFDRTITVYTNQKTAISRLVKKGVLRRDAIARLRSQMDIREKKRLADYLINNNVTKQQVRAQVNQLYRKIMEDKT